MELRMAYRGMMATFLLYLVMVSADMSRERNDAPINKPYQTLVASNETDTDHITACAEVQLDGSTNQNDVHGCYEYSSEGCTYAARMYTLVNGPAEYIIYKEAVNLNGLLAPKIPMWLVYNVACGKPNAYLRVHDDADYPEDITAIWQEPSGDVWTDNPNIAVTCNMMCPCEYASCPTDAPTGGVGEVRTSTLLVPLSYMVLILRYLEL